VIEPKLPAKELLEQMHAFPTDFTFKAIGDFHENFLSDVLNRVTAAFAEPRPSSHSMKLSEKGNHASVTIIVFCHNADEVHLIYKCLLEVSGLKALF